MQATCRLRVDSAGVKLLLEGAELLDPESERPAGATLLVEGGRITARLPADRVLSVDALRVYLDGLKLAPGFLDLHHHGALATAAGPEVGAVLREVSEELAGEGTTAFLATTVTGSSEAMTRVVAELTRSLDAGNWPGAEPLGVHLEGPWIRPEVAGAHPAHRARPFDARQDRPLLDRAGPWLRAVTLAPELPGSDALLVELRRRRVVAAVGHSLASGEELERAIGEGLAHATHIWNGMGAFHHRQPGLAGLVLADDRLGCDLICDGIHVHPAIVRVTQRVKRDRLALITDRVMTASWEARAGNRAAGRSGVVGASPSEGHAGPDRGAGPAGLGRLREAGGAVVTEDGRLAGSSLRMDAAVRNYRAFTGVDWMAAIRAATLTPARLLGIERERGTLRPGARADLVVLDSRGWVVATLVAGRVVHGVLPGNAPRP